MLATVSGHSVQDYWYYLSMEYCSQEYPINQIYCTYMRIQLPDEDEPALNMLPSLIQCYMLLFLAMILAAMCQEDVPRRRGQRRRLKTKNRGKNNKESVKGLQPMEDVHTETKPENSMPFSTGIGISGLRQRAGETLHLVILCYNFFFLGNIC